MARTVYILCAATAFLCAFLLLRGYLRSGTRLLLWSSLCFVGLTLNNALLYVDLVLMPAVDLQPMRHIIALASLCLLVYGLIWDGFSIAERPSRDGSAR
jgi:hypothetical protein